MRPKSGSKPMTSSGDYPCPTEFEAWEADDIWPYLEERWANFSQALETESDCVNSMAFHELGWMTADGCGDESCWCARLRANA